VARSLEPLLSKATEKYCADDIDGSADSDLCEKFYQGIYNQLFAVLKGFSFFDAGLNIGYEAEQRFDANNRAIGGFAYYSYENHKSENFLGTYNIKPAMLVSIESVSSSSENPRAMAGDDASYERVSYESKSASDTSTNESFIPVRLTVIALANCSGGHLFVKSGIWVLLTALPNLGFIDIQPRKLTLI
jgi:hypothetical protein